MDNDASHIQVTVLGWVCGWVGCAATLDERRDNKASLNLIPTNLVPLHLKRYSRVS